MSQDGFQTSREVYHRIRLDSRLDAREFVIGYDAHGETLEEMSFGAFTPDGDRRERIDRLSSLT